ncbi:winged helix DNA-binding domain-containing protein [Cellulomonas sp. DKR-3]|uniref:Winged helix DNA-binding domain-containing protein n=1 Tax=Cellulomonas fulva TaxID=2835530 RepID=A0ABS5TW92_9CELL|nr:winged helix DNA-binding domain-containing protein [Cellulomonas fulva]MBT0993422.1 winged helix DNA-binding domain-containing protein [Cellulomonas fulva]
MQPADVVRHRLRAQHLRGGRAEGPAQVVRELLAVQAQELPVARWSLAQRSTGDDEEVRRLLDEGAVLRTHALRPTWHLLAPEDLRWVLRATSPRVHQASVTACRREGLDADALRRTDSLLAAAVGARGHLTREGLREALGTERSAMWWTLAVMHAELEGVLVSGRAQGVHQTYALAEERAPAGRDLTGDEALVELVRRFLVGHGPAGVRDLAWWASLTLTQVRRALAALDDEVERLDVAGTELWWVPAALPSDDGGGAARDVVGNGTGDGPVVDLLQAFDEAHGSFPATRSLMDPAGLAAHRPQDNAAIHVLLVDGLVAGWWRRYTRPGRVEVTVRPARELTAAEHASVLAAFAEHERFVGQEVRVEFG